MSLLIALTPPLAWRAPMLAGAVLAAMPDAAQARASGGYSRPSSGGYARPSVRTPSFSAPSYRAPSSSPPASSGGYSRPSPGRSPSVAAPWFGGSEGDRAFSRERSSQALQERRAQEEAARRAQADAQSRAQPRPAQPVPNSGWSGNWFGSGRSSGYSQAPYGQPGYAQPGYAQRPGWFAQQGWQAPGYAMGGPRSFGVWNGLFLWFMLDHLTRPGYGDFFRSHQSDPGYQQWRAEADKLAAENADLRRKLDTLDQQVAAAPADPKAAPTLPPDIPADVAAADAAKARAPSTAANDNRPASSGPGLGPGLGIVALVVLLGIGGLLFLAWRRRAGGAATATSKGAGPMTPLSTAANLLRNAVSGEPYRPEHFRVGMTITADPTPFILAAGATKVPMPDAAGGNMLLSVQAVGRVADGAASLVRLYLPDPTGAERNPLFQLHLDRDGTPDECRYFAVIDEVSPADPAEWGAWLDKAEGMIGWPEFQTKDGRVYQRLWLPGPQRIAPRSFEETIATAGGSATVRHQAMLYAAPTGAAAPAPQTEYILVSAVERQGQAWVEIRAGIDVNPAALSLA